jgi:type IV secretory pathway TraG/TraD family ATPase VirD4
MALSKEDKTLFFIFVKIFYVAIKWSWPLILFQILFGVFPSLFKVPAHMFEKIAFSLSDKETASIVYQWALLIETLLFCVICFGPVADAINSRIGPTLPSFRILYSKIRDGLIGQIFGGLFGGLFKGKKSDKSASMELDKKLITQIGTEKPAHVLTGFVGVTPIYTTDKQRTQHTQVIGSSGSGKTESVIKNWAYQDIARGRGFAMLDPKGDIKLASEIFFLCQDRKVNYLSLLHDCENSQTYNPLAYGDPSQCANKIFNSFDWESDYYKMRAFDFYQSLLRIMFRHCGQERAGGLPSKYRYRERILLGETLPYLRDPRQCETLAKTVEDEEDRAELSQLARTKAEDLSGLYSKLSMLCRSETVSKVFKGSDINVKNVVDRNEILLCQLPTAAYNIEARSIARMIIQDLNLVSSYRQQDLGAKEFYPVFIDEFNSFIFEGFLDFLEKARSANMGLVLAHQSLANLERINPAYKKQVFENCSTKIIMSHNDPDSAKYIAQAIGEYYHKASTHTDSQTSEVLGLNAQQGKAVSVREEKRFIVEPTWILNLSIGESFYLGNGGAVQRVKMRHFGAYYRDEMHDMNLFKKGRSNNVSNNQATGSLSSGSYAGKGFSEEQIRDIQEAKDREEAEDRQTREEAIRSEDQEHNNRPQF